MILELDYRKFKMFSPFIKNNSFDIQAQRVAPKQVLSCELVVVAEIGGTGVCTGKDNFTYDMNVKAQ